MSKPEERFRKIDLDAELVEEIESFLHEYPEVNYDNAIDFIQKAAALHMQELKKTYAHVQMDALSYLQKLVTNSQDAHR